MQAKQRKKGLGASGWRRKGWEGDQEECSEQGRRVRCVLQMHLGDFLLTVSKSLPLSGTGDSSTNGNVLYKRKTCILVVELFLHLLVLTGHQLQTSVCQRETFWRSSLCPCHSELLELFRVCNEGHACSPSTLH